MANLPETKLALHLAALQNQPRSQASRERLAQALLDWFTAGWSALPMPQAAALRSLSLDVSPAEGGAPVFGGATTMTPLAAAFANAGIAHLREIDDAHRAAMLHPGVIAISPVLALAAQENLTQRRVADAIIAGYEVSLRVGEALGTRHAAGFHATATAGTVGAAAAAGVALGLGATGLHHAMGIGATQAAGLWQLVDDDAHESKALHPAFAVRNGLYAAFAARAGFPGARGFMTGKRGMYALLAGDGPLKVLEPDADEPERINTATIKAWPCCAQLFTPLDATRALMDQHAFTVDEIESIDVEIFPHALKIAGVDWPSRPAEACFSLRYVVATLLHKGSLGIEDMERPELESPALRALASKIAVCPRDQYQAAFPQKRPAQVTIVLRDGQRLAALRELRRGDPEYPYDWTALQARMRAFVPAMDDAIATRLSAWCAGFADADKDAERCEVALDLFNG